MNIELAAIHEAGHSVMQWFVGWEPRGLQMMASELNATTAHSDCPHPAVETLSAIRKRLLVLLAGQAATRHRWPHSANNLQDWIDALGDLRRHLQRPNLPWNVNDGMTLKDREANDIIQQAKLTCDDITAHLSVRIAIDRIGAAFVGAQPDAAGIKCFPGCKLIAICETEIGSAFRAENPWTAWIEAK